MQGTDEAASDIGPKTFVCVARYCEGNISQPELMSSSWSDRCLVNGCDESWLEVECCLQRENSKYPECLYKYHVVPHQFTEVFVNLPTGVLCLPYAIVGRLMQSMS